MAIRTGDHRLVREVNRSLVLELIREERRSRADLAAVTGLNRATVSSLVDRLIADGLVREHGPSPGAAGRPPILLEVDPDAGVFLGAELGHDHLNVVASDFSGHRLARATASIETSGEALIVVEQLVELIGELMAGSGIRPRSVLGMGVSVPGLVDHDRGHVVFSSDHGWSGVPIRGWLEERLGVDIVIENDANAAAVGEGVFGIARRTEDYVVVAGTAGLGTGIVAGGRLLRGAEGWAGEFGHTTIDDSGPRCRCGNRGCWEVFAGERALIERIGRAVDAGRPTSLAEDVRTGATLTVPGISGAAVAGDAVAMEALAETGHYLGIGLANLIDALNPSLVVLGGPLSLAADQLLPAIADEVEGRALRLQRQACRLEVARRQFDSGAMDAIAVALAARFNPEHLRISRPTPVGAAGRVPARRQMPVA